MKAVVITKPGGPEVLQVRAVPAPEPQGDQLLVRVRACGLNRADLMQTRGYYPAPPGVPADIPGLELDPSQISFFVGRANVISSSRPGMARWREHLYSGLARIATRSTDFFRIPPDRVIELGAEVEI